MPVDTTINFSSASGYTEEDDSKTEFVGGTARLNLLSASAAEELCQAAEPPDDDYEVFADAGHSAVQVEFQARASGKWTAVTLRLKRAGYWNLIGPVFTDVVNVYDSDGSLASAITLDHSAISTSAFTEIRIDIPAADQISLVAGNWYKVELSRASGPTNKYYYWPTTQAGELGQSDFRISAADTRDRFLRVYVEQTARLDVALRTTGTDSDLLTVFDANPRLYVGARFQATSTGALVALWTRIAVSNSGVDIASLSLSIHDTDAAGLPGTELWTDTFPNCGITDLIYSGSGDACALQQFTLATPPSLTGGALYYALWHASGATLANVKYGAKASARPLNPLVTFYAGQTPATMALLANARQGDLLTLIEHNIAETVGTPYYVTTPDAGGAAFQSLQSVAVKELSPPGTSLLYLVSFDSGSTWVTWNGTNWAASSLANLQTEGMTRARVEGLLTAQWHGVNGFTPGGTIRFAIDLLTNNILSVPAIDLISITYGVSIPQPEEPTIPISVAGEGTGVESLPYTPESPLQIETKRQGIGFDTERGYHIGFPRHTAGRERRALAWILTEAERDALVTFFEARTGPLSAFLWTPPEGTPTTWHLIGDLIETKLSPNAYRLEGEIEELL